MHLLDLEHKNSPTIPLLWEVETPLEVDLIGRILYNVRHRVKILQCKFLVGFAISTMVIRIRWNKLLYWKNRKLVIVLLSYL